jgi:hypothetical protein
MSTTLAESGRLVENIAEVSSQRVKIRLIEGERWGSSGYYSAEMLKRDGPTAFPAGTQMYLDHPSFTEEQDRPERSVRDLAGVLITEAKWEKDGLYSEIRIYEHWALVIKELAEDIGISVRAMGEAEQGEQGGRSGPIITKITEGISVDFVTKAGAGGKIVSLIESARKHTMPDDFKNARPLIREATSDDRRQQLNSAVKSAYGAEDTYIWVQDFDMDDEVVYFSVHSEDLSKVYGQSYEVASDDLSVNLTGGRYEVRQRTQYVPVSTPQTVTEKTESKKADSPATKEAAMGEVTIDERELTTLRESAGKVEELQESLKESQKETVEAQKIATRESMRANRQHARRIVAEELQEAKIKAPALAKSLSVDPPILEEDDKDGNKAGSVNEAELRKTVKEAIAEIQVEVDESSGGVRGFGPGSEEKEFKESDFDDMSATIFGRKKVGA